MIPTVISPSVKADRARSIFAEILDVLNFIKSQLAAATRAEGCSASAGRAGCGRPWASETWSGIRLRRLEGIGHFDEAAAVECDQ